MEFLFDQSFNGMHMVLSPSIWLMAVSSSSIFRLLKTFPSFQQLFFSFFLSFFFFCLNFWNKNHLLDLIKFTSEHGLSSVVMSRIITASWCRFYIIPFLLQ